jgi:hypothetical protein
MEIQFTDVESWGVLDVTEWLMSAKLGQLYIYVYIHIFMNIYIYIHVYIYIYL